MFVVLQIRCWHLFMDYIFLFFTIINITSINLIYAKSSPSGCQFSVFNFMLCTCKMSGSWLHYLEWTCSCVCWAWHNICSGCGFAIYIYVDLILLHPALKRVLFCIPCLAWEFYDWVRSLTNTGEVYLPFLQSGVHTECFAGVGKPTISCVFVT